MEDKNSFEIYIDIHNAGTPRTLTVVPEGETFSILLNGINIAQIDHNNTDFEEWHLRFGNLSVDDVNKIRAAIDKHYGTETPD
jgi:hypothetical protein